MSNDAVFAADPEGFRESNAGRPAAHLIRELIQNVFDERATRLEIALEYQPGSGVSYRVVDDVEGGIRDERLIWTVWLSDKQDSPTKRGRMGRGLKEIISVSDHTLIVTEGSPAIEFKRAYGKWTRSSPRKNRPKRGTVVEGQVKLWKKTDLDAIVAYLRRMRPPDGLAFIVNGAPVQRASAAESYEMNLPTVVFTQEDNGRVMRERTGSTRVDLFAEPEPWVYEMGIPVEPIEYPLSIDVGQRVPLREKRDTLTDPYRRELFAKLLDRRVAAGLVSDAQMRDNHVLIAASDHYNLSDATKRRIASVYTDGRAFATTAADVSMATGMHVPVVALRSLPEAIRTIAREVGVNVRDTISQIRQVDCDAIPHGSMTDAQRRMVASWEWVAEQIGRPCRVILNTGKPSFIASFSRAPQPGDAGVLNVYVDNFGSAAMLAPFGAKALSTLIHELSHWQSHGDEHGGGFTSDSEDVGALVAALLFDRQHEAWNVLWGQS